MFQMNRERFVTRLKDKIQYFEDHSTLQRFGHVITITKSFLFKRLFWLVFLSACFVGAGAVLQGALSLFARDAVSYSVETDYLDWNTPFPAVTLCQYFGPQKSLQETLAKKNIPPMLFNFAKNVMYWSKTCQYCSSACLAKKTCVDDIVPLVEALRAGCEDMLTDCWWNDEMFSCCDRFLPIKTQYGTCFVFNSRQIGTEEVLIVNRTVGLSVLTFSASEYITIKVHSPDEIITVASDSNMGQCGNLPLASDFEVSMSAEQTISDLSVRAIAQGSRDCLFLDELPAAPDPWPFPRYSFSACVWYCKARAQAELCNCTHHFMPLVENFPVCDVRGLACLHKNKNSFDKDECDCPLDCEKITYKVIHASCNRLSGSEAQRGTRGQVRLGHLPSLRVRRQAIRDILGLVVDFGGVVGVFFGASLLSFIEIVYIFCIRKSL